MSTYRVGNHQPQNVYRGKQYIGVMFTAEDAALAVEALNRRRGAWLPVAGLRNDRTYDEPVADTKVGPHPDRPVLQGRRARGPKPPPVGPDGFTLLDPDEAAAAHAEMIARVNSRRRSLFTHPDDRAHCPPDRPWDEGICDGSGRTCPRHGAVM